MKKIIISLGLCLCIGFTVAAQEMTASEETTVNPALVNKRGISLLPEAGDFAIGIDATPFLNYLGNFFNQAGSNTAPYFEGVDYKIYGKYFLESDRAIRAKLMFNIGNDKYDYVVADDERRTNNPLDVNATTLDVSNYSNTSVGLSVGYEFRRGRGRIQGFYGGEVGVGFETSKIKYEYGNPITAANPFPTTWFGYNSDNTRTTEYKNGNTISAGVAGFVGVEYFFAPQLSIGGEFNLGFAFSTTSQSERTGELWDTATNSVRTLSARSGSWNASEIRFSTVPTGSIFLMFHF